ncbi:hypothetical protein BsWGS_19451 [Bradybaena similaris]
MNTYRLLLSHYQRYIRGNIPVAVALLTLCLILAWKTLFTRKFHIFCPSERHQHLSGIYRKAGINVIPSTLQPQEVNVSAVKGIAKNVERVVDPYENECLNIKSPDERDSYVICIHDPYRDVIVSGHLKGEGSWEQEHVQALYDAKNMFPGIALIDLGCNIGVFTIPAAKIGMEVIAVDTMLDSLRLLQRSLLINDLTCPVTLVHNAVHRKRMKVRLVVDATNLGGTGVRELADNHQKNLNDSQLVDAICLDHLVPLVKGKTVFLKIDLQGSEAAVFDCAEHFFRNVNVKVLLMEWAYLRKNNKDSVFITNFLTSQDMVPASHFDKDIRLDIFASNIWPDQVYWLKKRG